MREPMCGMHMRHVHGTCCGPVMGHPRMGHPPTGFFPREMTPEEEVEALRRHKEMLLKRLEQVEERLKELSN